MAKDNFNEMYSLRAQKRFDKTLKFMSDCVSKDESVLDIGVNNPFSDILRDSGYDVINTPENTDLDLDFSSVMNENIDVVTSFEIFEHLVSPFPLLKAIKAKKLIASVPLKLWFANAYWNENDPFDRHYHEFESRQFDMLLEKAGWEIKKSEKWTSSFKVNGIRPLLRKFVPRYYIVYCERKK